MNHKICPRCGQPAVLDMPSCRRCGLPYPAPASEPTMTFDRPLSAASLRELERARAPVRRAALPWLAGLFALVVILGAAGLARKMRPPIGAAPIAGATGQPAPTGTGMRDPTAGMFVEREGRAESPTLEVSNADNDTMFLLLKDETGRVYHLEAKAMATASLQIPAGRYNIAVSSDNPAIQPNYGDAVFRRHKEYSATFVQSLDYGPIHLGD